MLPAVVKRLVIALAAIVFCWLFASVAASVASAQGRCPVGHSQMGCSLPPVLKGLSRPPAGEIVPDVSSYQRTVNWSAVKAWQLAHGWKLTGGIFKLGENSIDPYALSNAHGLHANGMGAIGYVFVRPGLKASTVIGWARSAGIRVVVLDEEVPGINGTAARITPALKAAGLIVVDYHAQGNIFDSTAGGMLCWTADIGPTSPPRCTTGPDVAWQFTWTGSITGITGRIDESISYGLLRLTLPPRPPRLICFGKHATPSAARCAPVLKHYDSLTSQATALKKRYSA